MTINPDDQNEYDVEDFQSGFQIFKKALKFLSENSRFISPYLKLFITFFQVLSSFISFGVVWPSFLLNIMTWLKGTLFLDVVALPGLSCLWHGVSFQSRLISYTLGPLVVITLLLVPVFVSKVCGKLVSRFNEETAERVISAAWKNIMFWVFLIYPVVSLSTMQAFNCQPTGLGRLAADFNEPCPGQTHILRIWSYVFIAVYPLGIPLFCYFSMLTMGVHLVARDIKCSLLLKSLVMKYADLSSSSSSEEINKLLADCEEDIKITKFLAVDMLVKFEMLDLEANAVKELLGSKSKHKQEITKKGFCSSCVRGPGKSKGKEELRTHEDGGQEITKKGFCSSCVGGPGKSDGKQKPTQKQIRERIQKECNENPSILSEQLLKVAHKMLHANTISIPNISWIEYQDLAAFKTKSLSAQGKESDHAHDIPMHLDDVQVDLKSTYAIHPDLDDVHEWGTWIKVQNSVGNLLMTIPGSWKTFNKRKKLGQKAFDRIGFLFTAYRVDYWYWEMLEMFRK
jgi:hypothetical protein